MFEQAYHDASTDEDRDVGRGKHKKHKKETGKEKKRKRPSTDAAMNGIKKRKKVCQRLGTQVEAFHRRLKLWRTAHISYQAALVLSCP